MNALHRARARDRLACGRAFRRTELVGRRPGPRNSTASTACSITSVRNNELSSGEGFAFTPKDIVGFRAPYLAHSPGLYATLAERGFRYDTSGTMPAQKWPEKRDGIWRFNLAEIKLAGSGRATLSMDYNFLVAQSGAAPIASRREQFRQQMLDSYLNYFRANYTGNRAPIHIGHHFSDYQNGAYRDALKAFARSVCGLPEVRCVTYKTLADVHGQAAARHARGLSQGRFPACERAGALRVSRRDVGAGGNHRRLPAFALRHDATPPVPLPSRAWRACASAPSDSR